MSMLEVSMVAVVWVGLFLVFIAGYNALNDRLVKLEQAKGEPAPPLRPPIGDYFEHDLAKERAKKWVGAACSRCSHVVPHWFRDEYGTDHFSDLVCKGCSEGLPHPFETEDEDMYVERYKKWRVAQREKEAEERKPA